MGEEYVKVRSHGVARVPLLVCFSLAVFYWEGVFIGIWDCFSEKPQIVIQVSVPKGNDSPLRLHMFVFFLFTLDFYSHTFCIGGIW